MVPLLAQWGVQIRNRTLLDAGCGEGGGLCALHDAGALCAGFDIDEARVNAARTLSGDRQILFATGNLYDTGLPFQGWTFDVVVLHDVFEHLEHKEKAIAQLKQWMQPKGALLITFPPYYSAYGAHQQHCVAWFARLPFFHLVPLSISHLLPRLKHERPAAVAETQKLARLKMGMRKFEQISRRCGLRILHKRAYIISPNHIRFGLRPLNAGLIAEIPGVNELLCSGVVYLLGKE
jgi:2-polyprenyl-3-methyl-5-hydroxy-6-metoxy-1,4-benzoquinol methylase